MVTVGADIEFFLGVDGVFHSAHTLLPGTKRDPFPVQKGALQVDGVAAEINIDPASNPDDFYRNIRTVLSQMKLKVQGFQILKQNLIPIDPRKYPPEVLEISCSSDISAYTGRDKPTLDPMMPFRTTGGHIHVGGIFEEDDDPKARYQKSLRLGRLMDKHLSEFYEKEPKNKRRECYGAKGTIRLKPYGIEYRTLSGLWALSKSDTYGVYNGTINAVESLKRGEDYVFQEVE